VLAECSCTTAAVVLAERDHTAAAVGSCPRTVAEGDAAVPRVGCKSCGTSGEHR
jgi:hypothetical protein